MVAVNTAEENLSSSMMVHKHLAHDVYLGREEYQQGGIQVWVEYSFFLHNHLKNEQALDENLVACIIVKQFFENLKVVLMKSGGLGRGDEYRNCLGGG